MKWAVTETGSQLSFRSTGVICSNFLVPVAPRATVQWTSWSLHMLLPDIPYTTHPHQHSTMAHVTEFAMSVGTERRICHGTCMILDNMLFTRLSNDNLVSNVTQRLSTLLTSGFLAPAMLTVDIGSKRLSITNFSETQARCISPFVSVHAAVLGLGMQLPVDKRPSDFSQIADFLDHNCQGHIFTNSLF